MSGRRLGAGGCRQGKAEMRADTDGMIAITGMAVRLPGAEDVGGYWEVLRQGKDCITRRDKSELAAGGADADLVLNPGFVPAMGVLPTARRFDWQYFGYSRAEAARIDPQQRIFLECAVQAMDDAGIDPTRFPGWIGVYAGSNNSDVMVSDLDDNASPLERGLGKGNDFVATRVAYKLGLRGPALTVQTACSTSLTAVHLAVQSLQLFECDAALAGGVGLAGLGTSGYLYQEGSVMSQDGYCRPFDARASGMVPGEGAGIVVLRRLDDALSDGDQIMAVIRGTAINNDGDAKAGFAAPSVSGQRDVILLAQRAAGVDAIDIDYVEAHGTATPIGDPVEVQALTDAFRQSANATGWCWLGAVKGNIGHTGAAAGVAGLVKTALMLDHRELVPTPHFTEPNPLMRIEDTPFQICSRRRPWPDRGLPLAAVSAFGVGGTNAHVIVQGPPERDHHRPGARPCVIGLSARSPGALDRMRASLASHLGDHDELQLAAVSLTLARRRQYGLRLSVVAQGASEAASQLRGARPADDKPIGRVAFIFPGHGTLTDAAGAAAYRLLSGFRGYFDELAGEFRWAHQLDLSPVVTNGGGDRQWFSDLVNQQCGLVTLGYALGRQLLDWGITPFGLLGNSIGEYTAAMLAGLWSPAEAARLVFERARSAQHVAPGRMVAIRAGTDEVADRIRPESGVGIAVAGPGMTVLSGPELSVDELLAAGMFDGLDLRIVDAPAAAHCEAMRPAAEVLASLAGQVRTDEPRFALVSNLTGGWAEVHALRTPGYWADQMCHTVQLEAAIGTLLTAGCDTVIEVGPGTSMCGAARRHDGWNARMSAVPMLGQAKDGERGLLRTVGGLWARGAEIDLAELLGQVKPVICALPPYSFDSRDPRSAPVPGPASAPKPGSARRAVRPRRRAALPASPGVTATGLEGLWCQALGVRSAAEDDDFLALGGESLTAVNLVHQVRDQLGATFTVADFLRKPTFGRLRELAGDARTADRPPAEAGLVPLRPSHSGRPVFFTADGTGTASTYLTLAGLLDCGRPLFGLEHDRRAAVFPRIERIAARHVAAVKGAQPEGPYTIVGWSFGAVVGHEMACQLTEAGDRVDTLLCLDGHVPRPRRLATWSDPAMIATVLRLHVDLMRRAGPLGDQVAAAPFLRRELARNARAILAYQPRPVPCAAVVFKAGAADSEIVALMRDLGGVYADLRIVTADGDHWSMLAQPQAAALAMKLRAELLTRDSNLNS